MPQRVFSSLLLSPSSSLDFVSKLKLLVGSYLGSFQRVSLCAYTLLCSSSTCHGPASPLEPTYEEILASKQALSLSHFLVKTPPGWVTCTPLYCPTFPFWRLSRNAGGRAFSIWRRRLQECLLIAYDCKWPPGSNKRERENHWLQTISKNLLYGFSVHLPQGERTSESGKI